MQLTDLEFLLSPEGQQLLIKASDPPIDAKNHLQAASRLREQVDPPLAQAIIETVILRQRGV